MQEEIRKGDWVEWSHDLVQSDGLDVSGVCQVLEVYDDGDLLLMVPGDRAKNVPWKKEAWKLAKRMVVANLIKELNEF